MAFAEPGTADFFEGCAKGIEGVGAQAQSCGHGMATKFIDQAGSLLRYQVERIAQMKAGDGTARSLDHAFAGRCEGDGGAVELVFQARSDDTDHALMPGVVKHADGTFVARVELIEQQHGSVLHAGLDVAPLAVDAVQFLRNGPGPPFVIGAQAFDTQ